MRKLLSTAVASSLLILNACADDTPPPQPPAPPPPPPPATVVAAPPPPPADTTPPPPPKPSMADLQAASVKAVTDAMNAHDPQKYAAVFATDGVQKQPGVPDASGRDAIAAALQAWFTSVPDLKFAFGRAWTAGNVAISTWAWTGTDTGGVMGAKPTGRSVGLEGATVATYNDDGTIKELHVYEDLGTLHQQLDPKAKKGTFRAPPTLPASFETIPQAGSDEESKNLASAKKNYQDLDDHKVADVCAPVNDDAAIDDYTASAAITGGKACKAWLDGFVKALPDLHQLPLANQWAIGSYVVSEGVTQGTHKGAFGPFKATGKPVAIHFLDIGTWKDGKYSRFQTWSNAVELMTQIGAIKSPGAAADKKADAKKK